MRTIKDFLYDFCFALYILALPGSLFFAAVKTICLRYSIGIVAANTIPAVIVYFAVSYITYYRAHKVALHNTNEELHLDIERLLKDERSKLAEQKSRLDKECVTFTEKCRNEEAKIDRHWSQLNAERRELIHQRRALAEERSKLAEQRSQLDKECVTFIEKYRNEEAMIDRHWSQLNAERRELRGQRRASADERAELNQGTGDIGLQADYAVQELLSAPDFSYLFHDSLVCSFRTSVPFEDNRIHSALADEIAIIPPVSASCSVRGTKGDIYKVTMNSCTCHDFIYRRQPCKHMYRLALSLGYLTQLNSSELVARKE